MLALGWDYSDDGFNVFDTLEDYENAKYHPRQRTSPSRAMSRRHLDCVTPDIPQDHLKSRATEKPAATYGTRSRKQEEPTIDGEGKVDLYGSSTSTVSSGTTATATGGGGPKRLNALERLTLLNCYGFTMKEIKTGEEKAAKGVINRRTTNKSRVTPRTTRWKGRGTSKDESCCSPFRGENTGHSKEEH